MSESKGREGENQAYITKQKSSYIIWKERLTVPALLPCRQQRHSSRKRMIVRMVVPQKKYRRNTQSAYLPVRWTSKHRQHTFSPNTHSLIYLLSPSHSPIHSPDNSLSHHTSSRTHFITTCSRTSHSPTRIHTHSFTHSLNSASSHQG